MEPVYREIGYCSDVGTLWRKLNSDQCDWLGIDEKGDYTRVSGLCGGVQVAEQDVWE